MGIRDINLNKTEPLSRRSFPLLLVKAGEGSLSQFNEKCNHSSDPWASGAHRI